MRLKKINDVDEKQQTDKLKMLIYHQIEKFVLKYQPRYYPAYQGNIEDLIMDTFEEFLRKKKHRNGRVFSELDRLDPSVVGQGHWTADEAKAIATYTQRFVTHTLIDRARTDKHEVKVSENYDENYGGLTLDRAAQGGASRSRGDDGMVGGAFVENINYKYSDLMTNPIALKKAKEELLRNPKQVKYIQSLVKHYGDRLAPDVLEFIEKFVGLEDELPEEEKPDLSEIEKLTGGKASFYSLQKKPALKIEFSSKDELRNLDKEKLDTLAKGYTYYTTKGNKMYYFKES